MAPGPKWLIRLDVGSIGIERDPSTTRARAELRVLLGAAPPLNDNVLPHGVAPYSRETPVADASC